MSEHLAIAERSTDEERKVVTYHLRKRGGDADFQPILCSVDEGITLPGAPIWVSEGVVCHDCLSIRKGRKRSDVGSDS